MLHLSITQSLKKNSNKIAKLAVALTESGDFDYTIY